MSGGDADSDFEGWEERSRRRRRNAWLGLIAFTVAFFAAVAWVRLGYPAPSVATEDAPHLYEVWSKGKLVHRGYYPLWAKALLSSATWVGIGIAFAFAILRRIGRTKPWQ